MRTRAFAAVGLAVALLAAAGCGDDDDSTATDSDAGTGSATTPDDGPVDGELTAYCDAVLALETAPEPEIDFEAMSPEEQAAVVRDYASETMTPLVEDITAAAPAEIESDLAVARQALDDLTESGDWVSFDESPEVAAALGNLHAHDLASCGWQTVALTAKDYSFEGLPTEIEAGVVSFDLTNEGTEMHEIALLRKKDGVSQSFEEILQLPQEEGMEMADFLGVAFAAPGDTEYKVADLTPGEYVALCFIPVGTTSPDTPPSPDAPPHFVQGMVHEFTVT